MLKQSSAFIRGLHNLKPEHRGSVVTIGSFDGVHLGHQAIIKQLKKQAKELDLPSVAIIFEPQPHEFFVGDAAPARLMRLKEKALALYEAGINRVCCLAFNQDLRTLTAAQFVSRILVDGLGVRYLVVGDDFRFGCDRSGDFEFLQQAGIEHDFQVSNTHTFEIEAERVSSTRIRTALECADFKLAQRLLGRPYTILGKVGYGQQLGRLWGVPTANVQLKRYRAPFSGVYMVKVTLANGDVNAGVANVGVRPTVGDLEKPILEVHLLDFDGNLYGMNIGVEFVAKLRDEKKFDSLDALKKQILADVVSAKNYFSNNEN